MPSESMRYYRGCVIGESYEFRDERGRRFTWCAWSVDKDFPLVCAMTVADLQRRIDALLSQGVQVKCAMCDDYGMTGGIGGREMACPCGLAGSLRPKLWIPATRP